MTGLIRYASPPRLIRLAVLPLLALFALVVTGDSVHAASFSPINTSTYCAQGSGTVNVQSLEIGCTPDVSAGANSDIVSQFNIAEGDYNFGGVVNFSPTVPDDAAIPVGAILGVLASQPTLGLLSNTCTNGQLRPSFTFMKGTTDINSTAPPLPFGSDNDLAILGGDTAPFDGNADVNPPPAVTQYPSFLNAIFDPNWVDFGPDKISGNGDDVYNGPKSPIKPVFRAVGATSIPSASNLWVILQLVVFDKGTKLPNLPAFDPAYGYPSVVVLQTASAAGNGTPPAPSAVTDFCTPLATANVQYGITQDNPATGPNEGGIPIRTLPAAGTEIISIGYSPSQRDADGDGFENSLDTCPFNADTVWSPRSKANAPRPGDGDDYIGTKPGDGVPDTCDSTPAEVTYTQNTSPGVGPQPTDHDGDGFLNSGDNCPLIQNPDQKDTDKDANGEEVGDGIGNACDTPGTAGGTDVENRPVPERGTAGKGPEVPDGEPMMCIKVSSITVGGSPDVGFSPCQASLPPLAPGGTIDTGSVIDPAGDAGGPGGPAGGGAGAGAGAGAGGGGAAGGAGGPASGIGSLSPVGGTVPAWAAVAAALGAAGVIGSLGTMASRLVKRRRDN